MNNYFKNKKGREQMQKGITLVALVITIVIIIILATVSISAVFGDSGLIKRAQEAKEMTANSIMAEQEEMNKLLEEYDKIMNKDSNILDPEEPEEPEVPYVDSELAAEPTLSDGMIPIKWNGTNWVKTTKTDSEWYDYANKEWANIVLGDATFTTSGNEEILDESKAYSMLVWIPRYAYQITSLYHQNSSTAGNINVVFIDENNQNKDKSKTYSETYPSSYATGTGMTDYVVHPAFNYGGTKLAGIWVGKYETSNTAGYGSDSSTANSTSLTAQIKAGVTSWRSITISNMFTVCTNINNSGNIYGLNTSDSVVDPHMMKNTEWGAVAYLSKSKYGKETEEIWKNPNSNYITGQAGDSASASSTTSTNAYNTTNGQKATATGNITGVYDMSGGAYEYVAAYVNNGNSNLNTLGSNLVNADAKYKDVYSVGTSDSQSNNYAVSTPSNYKYGDSVYETSSSGSDSTSWYSNYSRFPYSSNPFFMRGGYYNVTSGAGVFDFDLTYGNNNRYCSFRVVLSVM